LPRQAGTGSYSKNSINKNPIKYEHFTLLQYILSKPA
jgi:hypothetical protein